MMYENCIRVEHFFISIALLAGWYSGSSRPAKKKLFSFLCSLFPSKVERKGIWCLFGEAGVWHLDLFVKLTYILITALSQNDQLYAAKTVLWDFLNKHL